MLFRSGAFNQVIGWQPAQPIAGMGVPHAELYCGTPNYGGCLPGPNPNVGSNGIAYVGFHTRIYSPPYNESIVQLLNAPLIAGDTYTISFDLMDCQSGFFSSGQSDFCVYSNIDTLFPACPPDSPSVVLLGCVPFDSISNVQWKRHSFSFVAPPNCNVLAFSGAACNVSEVYYYLDSVTLYGNTAATVNAALASSDTLFCEKQCIDFFDLSTNSPTSWQWLFTGATPDTSTQQNPTGICYNNYGSFDVMLIACNANGCDTVSITNFIQEFQNPTDSIWQSNDTLFSLPAFSYQWYETSTGILTGQTQDYLVTTQAGNYYCLITDTLGCIATSNIIAITTSITEHSEITAFDIFPNPNSGEFIIRLNEELLNRDCSYKIIDASGRLLFAEHLTEGYAISKKMTNGFYIFELNTGGRLFRKFFIVQ